MKILIIIPAFNEENSIASVIRETADLLPEADIVVIDDGSSDETAFTAGREGAAVLRLPVNLGIGGAVQTGYLYAVRGDYDVAVQLDGDGQHDPSEIMRLVEPIRNGEADCVVGSRFLGTTGFRSTFIRRFGILFFGWMIHWMTGQRLSDPTSGFRSVGRKVLQGFARFYPLDYPEVEALAILLRRGYRVKEVPVCMRCREWGRSSITPLRSMYYMAKVTLSILMTQIREVKKA